MEKIRVKTIKSKKERIPLLDEVRSFAILCMILYHAAYDLVSIFNINLPFLFSDWMNVIRDLFVVLFVFISGAACRLSSSNFKRGLRLLALALIVTAITGIFSAISGYNELIVFGILHTLSCCILLYALLEKCALVDKIPPMVGIILFSLLFLYTFNVQNGHLGFRNFLRIDLPLSWYQTSYLFPVGLNSASFQSADYFPLLPWLFMFMAGAYFGVYLKDRRLPDFFYKTHVKFLASIKHTLWIYLLHQPVLLGFFWLVFYIIGN